MTARRACALVLAFLSVAGAQHASPVEADAARSAERMVAIARGELSRGVREVPDGSNRAGRIRMYGRSTTPRFYPAPWCAYFVSWVARRAGTPLGPAGRGFGYVPYIRAWARSTGRWRKAPRSGDLIMFPQHVGLVETVYRNGTLTTIEGNSSNRVARRWRRWREASGYVRIAGGGIVRPVPRGGTGRPRPRPVRQPLVARITLYPSSTVAVGQTVDFSANDSSGDIVGFRWDLDGDGRFDDARGDTAARRYVRPGTVTVGLRISDRRGRKRIARLKLDIRPNQAPTAKLVLPDRARINTDVVGHAEESSDPDGRVVRYEWDMDGDGRWEAGGDHHTARYARPGVYTVGLRVTDDQGAVTETVRTIEITQRGPVARSSGPRTAGLGEPVSFDASGSYDPDGQVASWRWDFDGDGRPDAEGARPTWRFAAPGDRRVELIVADEWGAEARASLTVRVVNQAPTGRIRVPEQPVAGEQLAFDGSGSTDPDSRITAYEWDFDRDWRFDASGPQASWRYQGTGDRKVRLRLTDEWGAQRTVYKWIRLLQRPVARLEVLTSTPTAGSPVTLGAERSSDADGKIRRLEWDLDADGAVDEVTLRPSTEVSSTPAVAGDHPVAVEVVDDHGLRGRAEVVVTVR